MGKIHATAIIDSKAQLDSSVEVGPYSIIGPQAKIGKNTTIKAYVEVSGDTELGENNYISNHCVIGSLAQDMKLDPKTQTRLRIGNNNTFKESCTISLSSREDVITEVGNDNYIMVNVHIAHDSRVGNHVVMANNSGILGFCEVDDHVFISGAVGVHQFCRIGAFAMLGGVSRVIQDVPPYCTVVGHESVAYGINVIGLRRGNVGPEERKHIKHAYKILYLSNLARNNALDRIEKDILNTLDEKSASYERIKYFVDFIKASKRGILSHSQTKGTANELPE